MGASPKMAREKLSTTVSPETYAFLQNMVSQGEAATLAEALDAVVARVRRLENRKRLAMATTTYFEQFDPKAAREESDLTASLGWARSKIDFDKEI
jgi:hypothetical protein